MNMTDTKFLDSSVWLAYFLSADEKARDIIEDECIIYTSVISLLEIRRKLIKSGIDNLRMQMLLDFIKKRGLFIPVTEDICFEAAVHKLPAIDSIIYTSAMKNNSHLFTYDNDFRGMQNATVLRAF